MSDETEVVTGKCSPGPLAVREGERVARKGVKGQADRVLFAFSILM